MSDVLERPLMGVRTFRAINEHLAGISMFGAWFVPDQPHRAECRAKGHPGIGSHAAPAEDCKCGYYAWYSPDSATEAELATNIVGVVSAWGDVILHGRGFRSEYMQIEALVDTGDTSRAELRRLAHVYAVPLIAESEVDDFCRERGEVLEPSEPAVDPSQVYIELRDRLFESFKKMARDMKPILERMERAGYVDNRSARRKPTSWQEAIERKRNKPAFWREAAGGEVHDGR